MTTMTLMNLTRWAIATCAAMLVPTMSAAEATVFHTISVGADELSAHVPKAALRRVKPLPATADQAAAISMTGKVSFQPVALAPSASFRRLQIAFRARVLGEHTLEQNPLCGLAPELSNLPEYQVVVRDTDGATLRTMRFRQHLVSADWRDYLLLAYLPPEARSLEMTFLTNAAPEIHLGDIAFAWRQQDAILHNGDFALGPHNYSGWAGFERMGALELADDGKTVLNTMPNGAFYTERFPLTPGQNYQVSITWSEKPRELRVSHSFYDAGGKRIKHYTWKTPVRRKDLEPIRTSTNEFRFPEGAVTASIYIYAAIIHAVEIVPLP